MKKLIVLFILALSGCGSAQVSKMVPGGMLDVAPQSENELMYPEWGEPDIVVQDSSNVEGPYGVRKSDSINAFSYYLSQLGIEHEILPGDHLIVKLNKRVQFSTGSAAVSMESKNWLSQLGHYVATMPNIDVIIEGHADSTGTKSVNEMLSEKRALSVKQELMEQRVSSGAIYTRGYSNYAPKCSNSTQSGKACNRRVELSFILASN